MGELHETCNSCEADYVIGPLNSILYTYTKVPFASWVETHCTECGTEERLFVVPEIILACRQQKIHESVYEYPDIDILTMYNQVWGNEIPEERWITPHQEKVIAFMGHLLETRVDELFN